ncbi:dehydrogenase/reductase SDR family protein 7-like [Styela clava]
MDLSYETALYLAALIAPAALFSLKYAFRQFTSLGSDKVVVITGASSGIGKECAKEFFKAGCQVILCSRNVDKLEELKNELINMNNCEDRPEPCVIPLDISNEQSIQDAVDSVNRKFPDGIHILINNAGMSYRGNILSTSMDVHKKLMETNYFGHVSLTTRLLPSMIKLPHSCEKYKAHILSINSIQGQISIPHRSAYSASKFACTAFFSCLRSEVARFGINVCSVYPGYVKTSLSLNAMTGDGTNYGKMDATTESGMEPCNIAKQVVSAIRNNQEEVSIATLKLRLVVWLRYLFPSIFFWIMKKRANR